MFGRKRYVTELPFNGITTETVREHFFARYCTFPVAQLTDEGVLVMVSTMCFLFFLFFFKLREQIEPVDGAVY